MKCSRVRNKLMDYTSADLPPSEAQQICKHLMDCEECRREMELARRASSALDLLGSEEPTPSLVGSVREKLARDHAARRPVLVPRLALGFSAAALVAMVVIGWLRYGSVDHRGVVAVSPTPGSRVQLDRHEAPEPVKPSPAPVAPISEPVKAVSAGNADRPVRIADSKTVRHADNPTRPVEHTVRPEVNADAREIPSIEPDTDSERVMLIAVRPKEPEIYVTRFDSEDGESPTELTVVREFDEGGNITSVTIEGTSSEEDADDIAPAVDRTQLFDVPPAGDRAVEGPRAGGSARNA